jgi:hypothetical protein
MPSCTCIYIHILLRRHAEEHPEAGVLYRGFAIRVWQDPLVTSSTSASSSSSSNDEQSSSTGSWHADVFLNFYPKFDNAKEAEASDLIQVIYSNNSTKLSKNTNSTGNSSVTALAATAAVLVQVE